MCCLGVVVCCVPREERKKEGRVRIACVVQHCGVMCVCGDDGEMVT